MATNFDQGHLLLLEEMGLPNPFKTWRYPGAIPLSSARFLADRDEVLCVERGGAWRAYPLRLIAAHHIVQDQMQDQEVLVTF